MDDEELRQLLDGAAARINVPEFVDADPVQFARRYSEKADIEIASLLVSHIAWGRRPMILRDAERLLGLMGGEPYRFVREGDFATIADDINIHRTFFGRDLKWMLGGLRRVYSAHSTLESYASAHGLSESDWPAWRLARLLSAEMAEASPGRRASQRAFPSNLESTALKRLDMALRWLVRDDGIVDLGVWDVIAPRQLYIPLDTHVAQTSRRLGLLTRRSNDLKAVVELTENLRRFRPDDPVYYDFALFGIGVEGGLQELPKGSQ